MPALQKKLAALPHVDPLMQRTCMLISSSEKTRAYLVLRSGVTYPTIARWQSGKTRRPQAATLRAVLRVLGYDLAIVKGHP